MKNDKVPIMVRKKILIVDDEKLVRWALARKCAECGYQSVEAADGEEVLSVLQNALEAGALRTEVESLRGEVRRRAGYHEVIGVSRKMTELMKFVQKVAASEASTILIQGESGTGKDLVAKTIHYQSARKDKPFVAINCSAIPETLMEAELFGHERGAFTDAKAMKKGLFEVADEGTLFL